MGSVNICDRCDNETKRYTTSMFNTQEICMDCKKAERKLPHYDKAVEADRWAVMNGNWNFEGIGLDYTIDSQGEEGDG